MFASLSHLFPSIPKLFKREKHFLNNLNMMDAIADGTVRYGYGPSEKVGTTMWRAAEEVCVELCVLMCPVEWKIEILPRRAGRISHVSVAPVWCRYTISPAQHSPAHSVPSLQPRDRSNQATFKYFQRQASTILKDK